MILAFIIAQIIQTQALLKPLSPGLLQSPNNGLISPNTENCAYWSSSEQIIENYQFYEPFGFSTQSVSYIFNTCPTQSKRCSIDLSIFDLM
ncbi:unnamed protein product [Blepharisma stoltei]|uniref:Uncharacterized protein n=1 Tax=Blepharisma stoltei TaxID=1481888 RepID=A0AAU9KLU1_9CILI|nr:unnamed protein product [Blepharisma stoltei]